MKKILTTPLIALLLLGCGSDEMVEPQLVASIDVTPGSLSLIVSEEGTLSAVAKDGAGNPVSVTFEWRSTNPNVAAVSSEGVVRGRSVCFAAVTARVGKVESNPVAVAVASGTEASSAAASHNSCGD